MCQLILLLLERLIPRDPKIQNISVIDNQIALDTAGYPDGMNGQESIIETKRTRLYPFSTATDTKRAGACPLHIRQKKDTKRTNTILSVEENSDLVPFLCDMKRTGSCLF